MGSPAGVLTRTERFGAFVSKRAKLPRQYGWGQRLVVPEDALLQLAELRPWLQAEL
jgi:hypothetical protein